MFELCVRSLAWGLDTSLKAALVALVAAAFLRLLRLRDSNIRHRIWTAVLAGMFALPVLTPLMPALRLPLLPSPEWLVAWISEPAAPEANAATLSTEPRLGDSPDATRSFISDQSPPERSLESNIDPHWATPPQPFPARGATSAAEVAAHDRALQSAEPVAELSRPAPFPQPPVSGFSRSLRSAIATFVLIVSGVWLLVCALLCLRLSLGLWMAARLRRMSIGIDPADLPPALSAAPIHECPEIRVPLTVGTFKPQILLPTDWRRWPAEKLLAVIAHEQMHVQRADCAVALIAEINCCLYWFHPLAWWLKQQLSALAEQACDDAAIDSTGDRTRYARHLLEVAAQVSRQRGRLAPAGVSMARRSHVETRIRAILDFTRPLARRLTWRSTFAILAVMAPLVALTAALKPSSGQQSSTPKTAPSSKAEEVTRDRQPTDAPPGKPAPDTAIAPQSLVCTGAVLDAAANPISQAAIYIVPQFSFLRTAKEWPARLAAKSNASGRFEFTAEADEAAKSSGCMLLIAAEGHAPEFRPLADCVGRSDFSVSLARDDVPIRGRILTLEGQPVPDVTITVRSIQAMNSGDLTPFLDIVKAGNGSNFQFERSLHEPPHIPPTTTDADGRFNLRGIGPNRVAEIKVLGRSIQHALLKIMTRESEPIQARAGRGFAEMERSRGTPPLFGASFDWVAKPSRPITGTVVDSKTKQPLPGVGVGSLGEGHAKTDENGRFELLGCAKTANYRLLLGTSDPRYLSGSAAVDDTPGLDPLEATLELTRGTLITGRVIDKQTGKPIVHARVHYFPLSPNPNLIPGIGGDRAGGFGPFAEEYTDEAGHFSIAVLPGPGFIGVAVYGSSAYQSANVDPVAFFKQQNVPYAVDPPANLRKSLLVATSQGGQAGMPQSNFHAIELLNAPAQDELQLDHDIELVPARQLTGTIVDPQGNPLEGVIAYGLANEFGRMETLRNSQFIVARLGDDETRNVIFRHEARRLAAEINVTAGIRQPLRVALQPWGEVTGRLLNRDGTPLANIQIGSWGKIKDGEKFGHLPGHHATDDQGRLQILGLVPGLTYPIQPHGYEATPQLRIRLKPGEKLDAGDIKDNFEHLAVHAPVPEPPANAPPAPAAIAGEREASASRSAAETIRGRVVDARGKAVAGAKLHWFRPRIPDPAPMQPRLVATTNGLGDFHFVRPATGTTDSSETPDWAFQQDRLVVTAPGHGFAFLSPEYFRDKGAPPTSLLGSVIQAFAGSSSPSISLPSAGEPIRGRLVNIDGQPVSGATIKIRWFDDITPDGAWQHHRKSKADDQNDWAARVTSLINVVEPVQLRDCLPTATTDPSGRFELRDLGPNRLFQLLVTSDQTESTDLIVRNQMGQDVTIPPDPNFSVPQVVLHPKDFVHAVGPSRPLTGRVLDLDTGEPIAGAVVRAYLLHGSRFHSSREREEFSTRSAADGRYRLTGLPLGKDNRLVAFATGDVPYIPVGHPVDTSKGPSIEQDFRLKRGLWATGRVYDAATDQPFTGVIDYYWFRNRDLERQIPGLFYASVDGLYLTNSKGEFRLPVLPSRGILAFNYRGSAAGQNSMDRFPRGAGAEAIAGAENRGGLSFPTLPHYLIPGNYERVAEVNPEFGQADIRVDIPLYASQPVKIRVVDASGKPVTDCQFYGVNDRWGWQELTSAEPAIEDLKAGERRKVLVFHRERNLAGGLIIKPDDPQPIEIKLASAGRLTGRLLDEEGEPITDATVDADYEKLESDDHAALWADDPNLIFNPSRIPLDKNGRFQLSGLIPGWTYNAHASGHRKLNGQMTNLVLGAVFAGIQVEPGQTKDLGDLKIKPDSDEQEQEKKKTEPAAKANEKAPAPPAKSEQASVASAPIAITPEQPQPQEKDQAAEPRPITPPAGDSFTYAGTVFDPGGKPIPGAKLYAPSRLKNPPRLLSDVGLAEKGNTDGEGRFSVSLKGEDFPALSRPMPLIVYQPGYGLEWLDVSPSGERAPADVVLQTERLITGRLIDAEGRPVAGANVDVLALMAPKTGSTLDPFLLAWKQDPNIAPMNASRIAHARFQALLATTSDAQGRFVIKGVAAERVCQLEFTATDLAIPPLWVVNREGFRASDYREPSTAKFPRAQMQLAEPNFTHICLPDFKLTGRLTTDDGQPVVGASVWANSGYNTAVTAETDANGRYQLAGLGRLRPLLVSFGQGDKTGLLSRTIAVTAQNDESTKTLDVLLKRGIVVSGRVIDSLSGKGVSAGIRYVPLPANDFVKQPGYDSFERDATMRSVDAEGHFEFAVLPGPGVIMVQAHGARVNIGGTQLSVYRLANFSAADSQHVKVTTDSDGSRFFYRDATRIEFLNVENAVKYVNFAAGTGPQTLDLTLDRGQTVDLELVDAHGQPVQGVFIAGITEHWPITAQLSQPRCTVYALGSDRPRKVLALQTERGLAGSLALSGDEPSPVRLTLNPSASLRGRAVDDVGEPIAAASLSLNFASRSASELYRFHNLQQAKVTTDKDGRFAVANIVPGERFNIDIQLDGKYLRAKLAKEQRTLSAGQSLDLGNVVFAPPKPSPEPKTAEPQKATAERAIPAGSLTVRGSIVNDAGNPVAGAHLAVIGLPAEPQEGVENAPRVEVLADGKADDAGRFHLPLPNVSAKSHESTYLIARAAGTAVAWQKLSFGALPNHIALQLRPEEPVRVRLIDLDGQPAASVRLEVGSVMKRTSGELSDDGVGYGGDSDHPAWIAPLVADQEGRFTIHGLARDQGIWLSLEASDRFGPQGISLNTGLPEQRPERDATYRDIVRNVTPGEELIIPLSPAQVIEGTIRYEDTGAPVPHALVSVWASQQRNGGSMTSVEGKTDAAGHYRISANPGIRFGVMAYAPTGEAYLIRRTTEDIRWENGDRVKQQDLTLPSGVLIRGKVLTAGRGQPIANAAVQFIPQNSATRPRMKDVVTGWQGIQYSGKDGSFQIAVPPGPGHLLVSHDTGSYVLQEIGGWALDSGQPGGERYYAHAIQKIEPAPDAKSLELNVELQPAVTVTGRIVDQQGQPAQDAVVISRLNIVSFWLDWHGQPKPAPGGRFELKGLQEGIEYPTHFLDPKRRLGATVNLKTGDVEPTIVLQPCGSATVRFVDPDGKPIADHRPSLDFVVTPGAHRYDFESMRSGQLAADADFAANVDRTNHGNLKTDAEGKLTIPALIPGATYAINTANKGRWQNAKEFQVHSGQTLDLGDITIIPSEK